MHTRPPAPQIVAVHPVVLNEQMRLKQLEADRRRQHRFRPDPTRELVTQQDQSPTQTFSASRAERVHLGRERARLGVDLPRLTQLLVEKRDERGLHQLFCLGQPGLRAARHVRLDNAPNESLPRTTASRFALRPAVTKSSRIPGFHRLDHAERLARLAEATGVPEGELEALAGPGALGGAGAEHMIENAIGTFEVPLGVATNFRINGRDLLVPMAIEEPSVVAAASNGAKAARLGGGFVAWARARLMIGQIQVVDLESAAVGAAQVLRAERELIALGRSLQPRMVERGGGLTKLEARVLPAKNGQREMLVVHLLVDTVDAMGANSVNGLAERMAPEIERLTGGRTHLRILSNLTDECLAGAEVKIPPVAFSLDEAEGRRFMELIVLAQEMAERDPYRAVTHNKGIMNGIDAVVLATGNDWRAIEAGAHAHAAKGGSYQPLSRWHKDEDGMLVGRLELPMPVGLVGGSTKVHPTAQLARRILGVETAKQLAGVIACVGLAQNLSALRALATEGIQRGHMELHARTVARSAGAEGEMVDRIAETLVRLEDVRVERAKELLAGAQS